MSSSLDFLNFRGFFDEQHREDNHLKWLTAFSSNPVSLLPVFLASETERETRRRASSISVLTSTGLNCSTMMESATFPRSFQFLTVPGAVPKWQADHFRATALWENTVFHLENSIKPGRHTRGLKVYENCFRGAQAVACLSTYLNAALPKTVSRAQVLILCQKLVMTGVMEDVKDKERTIFKEGRLYRFSKEHFWQQPAAAVAELDSSPSPTPTVSGCQSPTLQKTLTERHNMSHTTLASSIKYPSDSIIAVSSHIKHLFHRQSPNEPHREFKRRNTTAGQKLKKAKSLMLHRCTTKFRSDPPPESSHRGKERAIKLSRRNAMRRESRPLKLAKIRDCQAFTEGNDEQGVYRAMAPAQRSQSQSYKMKAANTSTLRRKFTERRNSQTEKEDVAGIKGNSRKRATVTENDHAVKTYCIDTYLGCANKPKLFNVNVNPVSSVRGDAQTAAPPAGMNWVVYGYL